MKKKQREMRPSIRMGKGKKCGCVLISIDEVAQTNMNEKIKCKV
jgi:hypothetical protein